MASTTRLIDRPFSLISGVKTKKINEIKPHGKFSVVAQEKENPIDGTVGKVLQKLKQKRSNSKSREKAKQGGRLPK